jgi:hypothetical protein
LFFAHNDSDELIATKIHLRNSHFVKKTYIYIYIYIYIYFFFTGDSSCRSRMLQPPRPTMRPMSRSSTSISSVSPPRPFANVDIWNDETKLKTRICLSKAQGTFQNRITPKPQYIYIYW